MYQVLLFLLMLSMFLFGMYWIRTGLFHLSSDWLKKILTKLTDSPWKGLLLGAVITAFLQSSSAVSIMVVGLVAGRIITFSQSIGIILGASIGSTITLEIIALEMNVMFYPLAGIGAILLLFKKKAFRNVGMTILGFAAVFGAMWGFQTLATPLQKMPFMNQIFLMLDNQLWYAVLAGAILTAIIHSDTATTGITMGFIAGGVINLDTAVAIVLGANIGSCIDPWLASIGAKREAKLTAWSHIWLNIIGVMVFFPFIGLLAQIGPFLAERPDVQVAHINVLFNVLCSLIALPFVDKFAMFIKKIHDRKPFKES